MLYHSLKLPASFHKAVILPGRSRSLVFYHCLVWSVCFVIFDFVESEQSKKTPKTHDHANQSWSERIGENFIDPYKHIDQ